MEGGDFLAPEEQTVVDAVAENGVVVADLEVEVAVAGLVLVAKLLVFSHHLELEGGDFLVHSGPGFSDEVENDLTETDSFDECLQHSEFLFFFLIIFRAVSRLGLLVVENFSGLLEYFSGAGVSVILKVGVFFLASLKTLSMIGPDSLHMSNAFIDSGAFLSECI